MSRSYDNWIEEQLEPDMRTMHEGIPSFHTRVHLMIRQEAEEVWDEPEPETPTQAE